MCNKYHFIEGETKAPKGGVMFLRPHNKAEVHPGTKPARPNTKVCILSTILQYLTPPKLNKNKTDSYCPGPYGAGINITHFTKTPRP